MGSPRTGPPPVLAHLGTLIEGRAFTMLLAGVVILSVLPLGGTETEFWPVFAGIFLFDVVIRFLTLRPRAERTGGDFAFLLIDLAALISFLPVDRWLGFGHAFFVVLRLTRLLVLARFAKDIAKDFYMVVTRREQVQQFALVSAAVAFLAFVSAVILAELGLRHPDPEDPSSDFWDRLWWAFRQLESADNLVPRLDDMNP
ncbi:MAG: ion transporter, partial [Myxococcales bacterium]|nr:ion transporter [Myxococcales bacterium]